MRSAVNKPKEEEDGDMRPKSDSKSSRDGRTFNSRAETSGRSARYISNQILPGQLKDIKHNEILPSIYFSSFGAVSPCKQSNC